MYLPMELYVEVIVTMNFKIKYLCSVVQLYRFCLTLAATNS